MYWRPLALCLLLCLPVCKGTAQNRDLSDTLAWMDNTYNPHADWLAYGHGTSTWYTRGENEAADTLAHATNETFTYNGCSMTLSIDDKGKGGLPSHEIMTFRLGDLNPDSVRIETAYHYGGLRCGLYTPAERLPNDPDCDHADVFVLTHNEAPLITAQYIAGRPLKETKVFFAVDNPEYAQRFSQALRHAIQLCGGRPQSF